MESKRPMLKKAAIGAVVALAMTVMFGLVGCAGEGGGTGGGAISNENKANAKVVIKAASNVFATTESLDLTDEDSPATIDQNDPRFATFYDELKNYKTMSDIDLKDCMLKVTIQSVTAATARGDSTQTNYRYTVSGVDMNVNGVDVSYDTKSGFSSK